MKRRKSKRRRNQGNLPFSVRFGILVTVLVMIVVAAGVLMAPGFKVSEVYCEGNVNVQSEEIFSAAQIESGKNIFLVGIGKAERSIKKLPMVKDVTVRRVFPNRIGITVEERTPIAYMKTGAECVAVDEELIVIKKEDPASTARLVKMTTPDFEGEKDEGQKAESKSEGESASAEEESISAEEEEKPSEEVPKESVTETAYFNVPLVDGLELKSAEENKKVKCEEEKKLEDVVKLCLAFRKAGLLNRATYLNVTDMQSISIVIENRLDVRLGNIDNIEYRASFLAEVINNKVSAYEKLILDYTGDDIYARTHDDGKDRTKRTEKDEDEDTEDTEDTENTDTEDEKTESSVTGEEEAEEEPEREQSSVGSL